MYYLINEIFVTMGAQRRKFTNEEKTHILQLAKDSGVTKVLREYKLSYSVFARWKQQLNVDSGADTYSELLKLKQENVWLKKIVAEQALEIEMKKELLSSRKQQDQRTRQKI